MAFLHFAIDGALLLTLDPGDLVALGIANPVHVKRLLLAIERRPQVRVDQAAFNTAQCLVGNVQFFCGMHAHG